MSKVAKKVETKVEIKKSVVGKPAKNTDTKQKLAMKLGLVRAKRTNTTK